MQKILEFAVRLRTWIVNVLLIVAAVLPDLMHSAEVIAIIPPDILRYLLAGSAALNILLRPRPAVIATDLEASVSRSKK